VDAVAVAAAHAADCLEGFISSVLNFNDTAEPWEGTVIYLGSLLLFIVWKMFFLFAIIPESQTLGH
jgi:hypothetical protein